MYAMNATNTVSVSQSMRLII